MTVFPLTQCVARLGLVGGKGRNTYSIVAVCGREGEEQWDG